MKQSQVSQEYTLQYMRRKSLRLQVSPEGEVLVQAPRGMRREVIDLFVQKHADWIKAQQEAVGQAQLQLARPLEKLRFLGKDHPVTRWTQQEICLQGGACYLPEFADTQKERRKVTAWYRAMAGQLLEKRTAYWAAVMGVQPTQIKISSARRRWGSCTSEGHISYTWRLLLAPPSAVDYVIIHELTHLNIMAHSPAFWELVARYCPNYKAQKALLEQTSAWMRTQGWDA